MLKYPNSGHWVHLPNWKARIFGPESNGAAAFMMLETDVNASTFGWAPHLKWQSHIGNVLIIREDHQDLDVGEARKIGLFCQTVLSTIFEDVLEAERALEAEERKNARQRVVNLITRENMDARFP